MPACGTGNVEARLRTKIETGYRHALKVGFAQDGVAARCPRTRLLEREFGIDQASMHGFRREMHGGELVELREARLGALPYDRTIALRLHHDDHIAGRGPEIAPDCAIVDRFSKPGEIHDHWVAARRRRSDEPDVDLL